MKKKCFEKNSSAEQKISEKCKETHTSENVRFYLSKSFAKNIAMDLSNSLT